MRTSLMLFFLLATMHWLTAQPSKFLPPNDLGKDKSLVTFVSQLKTAVKKKDKAALLSLLDKDIKNNFGGNGGIEEFKQQWHWPKDTLTVWHHLQRVLDIGGGFMNQGAESNYAFPYVFNLDIGEGDIFSAGVITGKNVNLREKPDLKAKVLTQLSYDVVKFSGETRGKNAVADPEWHQIETANHKKGWVFWKYVYSPVGYRLILYKDKGKWKVSAFVAGD